MSLFPPPGGRLALGTMRLLDWGLPPAQLGAHLGAVADLGVTVLDSADIYGRGAVEVALGEAFRAQPGLRERFVIVGKSGIRLSSETAPIVRVKHYDTSGAHVRAQVEQSLGRLGTDRLDLLLIHRPDPLLDAAELAACVADLLQAGKIRSFGVSNFRPGQVDVLQSRISSPLVTNQIEVSLWQPAAVLDGTLDHAQQKGLVPMAWAPLGGGRSAGPALAAALDRIGLQLGLTPSQLALAWLARHPAGLMPVLGTGRLERVEAAVAAMAVVLEREAWFELLEAATGHPVG